MPEIDLEPKDYRAQPIKGERVFTRTGIMRLGFVFIVVVLALLANTYLRPPVHAFFDSLLR